MADAPDLGSGGAILRGSSPLPGSSSWLAAILKENHLGGLIMEIKADGAIPADQIARDAATGAHAVDLVNADVRPDIKLPPRFDEDRALGIADEQKLQGRPFVFDVNDRRCCFECMIVQAGRLG